MEEHGLVGSMLLGSRTSQEAHDVLLQETDIYSDAAAALAKKLLDFAQVPSGGAVLGKWEASVGGPELILVI